MSNKTSPEFVLGSESEFLCVRALRRTHPRCTDYWDGNWITCRIEVVVGGFRARVDADLRAEDFVQFNDQLRTLNERSNGPARFATLEDWLEIEMSKDRLGHITAKCVLLDQPGIGNWLEFTIEVDQTHTSQMLAGLEAIKLAFPVLDAPTK